MSLRNEIKKKRKRGKREERDRGRKKKMGRRKEEKIFALIYLIPLNNIKNIHSHMKTK